MKRILLFLLTLSAVIFLYGCGKNTSNAHDSTLSQENSEKHGTTVSDKVCTLTIDCSAVFAGEGRVEPAILELLPSDGVVFARQPVTFTAGESVCDVLRRVCRDNSIPLESSVTPGTGSIYVEGICNLREFDGGVASGWLYRVNGKECGVGSSEYILSDGDNVEWRYSCEFGEDVKWDNK